MRRLNILLVLFLLSLESQAQVHVLSAVSRRIPTAPTLVTYDTGAESGTAGGTTSAVNITVGANVNRLLIATIWRTSSTGDATSVEVTAGGSGSFTKLGSDVASGLSAELWYLINPPSGALTITATWATTSGFNTTVVTSWYGVHQTTAVDAFDSDFDNFGDTSIDVLSSTNDMVISQIGSDGNIASFTSGGGQDRRVTPAGNASTDGAVDSEPGNGGTVTISFTSTAFNVMGIACNINVN